MYQGRSGVQNGLGTGVSDLVAWRGVSDRQRAGFISTKTCC
jgi:hypothetical protein